MVPNGDPGASPPDDRPCRLCGGRDHQESMILCDRCNACYHPPCAAQVKGTALHGGPWFCAHCKGALVREGFPDVTLDWPLHDYLWAGHLPSDPSEAERIEELAGHYRARGDELQVELPANATDPPRWVNVPPLLTRKQILADTHDALGHCGRDKLADAIRTFYWWPGL